MNKPLDNAIINLDDGTITYTTLPYPLPEQAQAALKAASRYKQGSKAHLSGQNMNLHDVERDLRSSLGVKVTRQYIPPNERAVA